MQSMIYFVGCCARRNAAQSLSRSRSRPKAWRGPIRAVGWEVCEAFLQETLNSVVYKFLISDEIWKQIV
jgi:hypothetical protein